MSAELTRAVTDVRAEMAALTAEVARLWAELVRLGERLEALAASWPAPAGPGRPAGPEQLVTLDQCAAFLRMCRRSLERYRGQLPAPRVPGRKGRPALYAWADVRPVLAARLDADLPETFPHLPQEASA